MKLPTLTAATNPTKLESSSQASRPLGRVIYADNHKLEVQLGDKTLTLAPNPKYKVGDLVEINQLKPATPKVTQALSQQLLSQQIEKLLKSLSQNKTLDSKVLDLITQLRHDLQNGDKLTQLYKLIEKSGIFFEHLIKQKGQGAEDFKQLLLLLSEKTTGGLQHQARDLLQQLTHQQIQQLEDPHLLLAAPLNLPLDDNSWLSFNFSIEDDTNQQAASNKNPIYTAWLEAHIEPYGAISGKITYQDPDLNLTFWNNSQNFNQLSQMSPLLEARLRALGFEIRQIHFIAQPPPQKILKPKHNLLDVFG